MEWLREWGQKSRSTKLLAHRAQKTMDPAAYGLWFMDDELKCAGIVVSSFATPWPQQYIVLQSVFIALFVAIISVGYCVTIVLHPSQHGGAPDDVEGSKKKTKQKRRELVAKKSSTDSRCPTSNSYKARFRIGTACRVPNSDSSDSD
ncbi:unnamed protein product, partial [Mesorhabditis spiculigera]